MRIALSVFLVWSALLPYCWAAKEKSAPKPRRYDDGPLRVEEFRGDPVAHPFATAGTYTRVLIQYSFQSEWNAGRAECRLTSAEVYAVFLPQTSWWLGPPQASLLDHEQGHFDLAEIAARKLQWLLNEKLSSDKRFFAQGATRTAAERALADKVRQLMRQVNDEAVQQNREYDQATRHGSRRSVQAEWRRVQLATLDQLQKKLRGNRRQSDPSGRAKSRARD